MYPSVKTIETGLEISREQALLIRNIMERNIDPKKMFPEVMSWYRSLYNAPQKSETNMVAFNIILEGYGVEGMPDPDDFRAIGLTYVNMGDTYIPTIIYDGAYRIMSWGDWIERHPRYQS